MNSHNIKDKKLFELSSSAVANVLPKIKAIVTEKPYIIRYYDLPSLKYRDNGLPDISDYRHEKGPTNYKDLFGGLRYFRDAPPIDIKDVNGVTDFINYSCNHDQIKQYYSALIKAGQEDYIEAFIKGKLEDLIEKYINTNGYDDFSIEAFKQIYCPIEKGILNEKLSIDILVPILFIKFDFDTLNLTDQVSIEKMDEEMHLSRISKRAYSPAITTSVISSATHALVLKNYEATNEGFMEQIFNNVSAYPLKKIDLFFNAIRLVCDLPCGYAQLLALPKDWVYGYGPSIIPLKGTSVKAYPSVFDDFYWNINNIPTLSSEKSKEIAKIYDALLLQENKKILIACKRLGNCYLRENEEDSILDAIIALESLLSDGDRGELTYKLAMRIAAILSLSKDEQFLPKDIFKSVKKIYDYRSAIIHGHTKADKKREIKLSETGKSIPAIELAVNYLRKCLVLLLEHTQYLKISAIDEDLILGGK